MNCSSLVRQNLIKSFNDFNLDIVLLGMNLFRSLAELKRDLDIRNSLISHTYTHTHK